MLLPVVIPVRIARSRIAFAGIVRPFAFSRIFRTRVARAFGAIGVLIVVATIATIAPVAVLPVPTVAVLAPVRVAATLAVTLGTGIPFWAR